MKYTYDELAKMIDHSLLHPTMTDRDLEEGCRLVPVPVTIKQRIIRRIKPRLKPFRNRP